MILFCYPKCSTCIKAKKWLDDNNISYNLRDIKLENPNEEELKEIKNKSNLPIKRLFNTSGLLYKELELKDKIIHMSEEEQYKILASNGMLVKRPIILSDDFSLIGFNENEWSKNLNNIKND